MDEPKKRILIIDDDLKFNNKLSALLSEFNYVIEQAENGKEGLNIALNTHPDLILLDINMPIVDGISFMKTLRLDEWGAKTKVIILTNFSNEIIIRFTLELCAQDYIIKRNHTFKDVVDRVNLNFKNT